MYKTELKNNCRCLIFIWEANMFMVFAASVDDKMIKFLQIKISWGINHLLGRSALWEWITKTTLTNYIYALADTETLAYGLYKPGNKVFFDFKKNLLFFPKKIFFLNWAPIFIWHVYWSYKVPCKISALWPQWPCMATRFCK